jgi:hypothetical protein
MMISINRWCGVLVGRRVGCRGGIRDDGLPTLLTPYSLVHGRASTNWSCCALPKDGTETAGLIADGRRGPDAGRGLPPDE